VDENHATLFSMNKNLCMPEKGRTRRLCLVNEDELEA